VKEVTLGYKAFDLHELTCHFVAVHAGLYARHGLRVKLLDMRPIPDEDLPDDAMSAACGTALLRWLRGAHVKVVFIASTRPMFWLYGRGGMSDLEQLANEHIAGYPPGTPPAHFLRLVFEEAGLDPENDVSIIAAPDDAARLALLTSGEAAAALISSKTAPRLEAGSALRRLCSLGDSIPIPTTGLAVDAALLARDPRAVAALRATFAAALRVVHESDAELRSALCSAGLVEDGDADSACALVREFYSRDGRLPAGDVLAGVRRLARSVNAPAPDGVDDFYACS
jgi:ABC-type nitrate/sulfonate/bicarbonate transport system substrate-binding protein